MTTALNTSTRAGSPWEFNTVQAHAYELVADRDDDELAVGYSYVGVMATGLGSSPPPPSEAHKRDRWRQFPSSPHAMLPRVPWRGRRFTLTDSLRPQVHLPARHHHRFPSCQIMPRSIISSIVARHGACWGFTSHLRGWGRGCKPIFPCLSSSGFSAGCP